MTGADGLDTQFTYACGADGARRARTEGGTTVRYDGSSGALLSEDDDGGTLVKTCIGALAEVVGSNPATGAYRYHFRDGHFVRVLRDHAKALVASTEFNTYGEIFHRTGSFMSEGYARHPGDTTVSLLFSSPISPGTGQSLGTGGNAFSGPISPPTPTPPGGGNQQGMKPTGPFSFTVWDNGRGGGHWEISILTETVDQSGPKVNGISARFELPSGASCGKIGFIQVVNSGDLNKSTGWHIDMTRLPSGKEIDWYG